MSQGYISLELK